MKRKVGSTFSFNGKTYEVKKRESITDCQKCAFFGCFDCDSHHMHESGECCGETRGDNVDVYFTLKK